MLDCDRPQRQAPERSFPPNGGRQVPIDAPLRVRYTPGYFEPGGPGGNPAELIRVEVCDGVCGDPAACEAGAAFVPGTAQVLGDEVVFLPAQDWAPNRAFSFTASGRDGSLIASFCTGSSFDEAAPIFGTVSEVTSSVADPSCAVPEGGYRIGVFFNPATDTGSPGSIEYLLYQTRGFGVDDPVLRSRAENFSATDQITMAFELPVDEAATSICVRVAAVDGAGNVAFSEAMMEGGNCVDPVQGDFFYGLCSASPGRPSDARGLACLGLLAMLLAIRRR